jgi:hypothetical protein
LQRTAGVARKRRHARFTEWLREENIYEIDRIASWFCAGKIGYLMSNPDVIKKEEIPFFLRHFGLHCFEQIAGLRKS